MTLTDKNFAYSGYLHTGYNCADTSIDKLCLH